MLASQLNGALDYSSNPTPNVSFEGEEWRTTLISTTFYPLHKSPPSPNINPRTKKPETRLLAFFPFLQPFMRLHYSSNQTMAQKKLNLLYLSTARIFPLFFLS